MSVYKGGIPYALDVKNLEEAFPVNELNEGRKITHGELSDVIGSKRGSGRYYGVIDSWIAKLKHSHGIVVAWEQGTGIKVLNPAEVLGRAETRTRQKIRQTGRAIREFGWVDRKRLDEPGRQRLDHQMRVGAAIKEALDSGRRQLAVELGPVKSLPKQLIPSREKDGVTP